MTKEDIGSQEGRFQEGHGQGQPAMVNAQGYVALVVMVYIITIAIGLLFVILLRTFVYIMSYMHSHC